MTCGDSDVFWTADLRLLGCAYHHDEGNDMTTTPASKLTASQVAEQIGTDPKTFRVYLRANAVEKDAETGRYAFTKAQAKSHEKKFTAWQAERAESRKAKRNEDGTVTIEGGYNVSTL